MTEDDESPHKKELRRQWRSGSSPAQKKSALNAKETLEFIKANPGCTRGDVIAAGIKPNFFMLTQHGLAYFTGGGKKTTNAQWWAKTK